MSTSSPVAAAERSSHASRAAADPIQAKLSVGRSGDGFEQEADRVANEVVERNSGPNRAAGPSPVVAAASRAGPKISRLTEGSARRKSDKRDEPQRKIQRAEEEPQAKIQRAEEEEAQAKVQRAEEEEAQTKLQRSEEEEPQAKVQRAEEEPQTKIQRAEDEEPQAKVQRAEEEEPQAKVQRAEDEEPQAKVQRAEEEEAQTKLQRSEEEEPQAKVQRQLEPRANQRDKRMYPNLNQVEGKLFENKGKGEALDDETRISMETGFGADFSGVRVHTGADAVSMSRDLKAQAFTHGSDVFFNSGKYAPDTASGRSLLAHELTHVVQQGAAEQTMPAARVEANNAARNEQPADPIDRDAAQVEGETKKRIEGNEPQLAETLQAVEPATPEGTPGDPVGGQATASAPQSEPATGGSENAAPEEEGTAPEKDTAGKADGDKTEKVSIKASSGDEAGTAKGVASARSKAGAIGSFLRTVTKPIFESKKRGIGTLATAEKQKDEAGTKLAQTEKSVVPPAEESQSRAKASQVESVEQAPEPQPDEAQAAERFESTLEAAVPTTLEEVDEFKEEGKGRVVGQAVQEVVSADVQSVKGTYQEIDNPPAPAPPAATPEELPALEAAPETANIAPGDGVVGEVLPEHTDVSNFENESDAQLAQEEINDEHLEMVDEGDLAEANKERKSLKTKVKDGPKEVKQFEQKEKDNVGKELQKEELGARQKMREERTKGLAGARDGQQKTKSKLELERQQVTDHINGIYQRANDTVKEKLSTLETTSLKAFETGEKQATKAFEDSVKRRIDAYKKRRYDRFGGSLLWAKDKLFGMDELPEVKGIFDDEKSRFVTAIDALVAKITAENKRVVAECKAIVAAAKVEIETFVAGLGPKLKQTGQDALGEMKGKLAALDEQINAKEQELQKKLEEKREAAIKAIEEKIEAMKEEMSGLVSKLGNLLLNAMLKFFKWALKKAGFAAEQLMAIINKGKSVIKKIVTDPIGFIGNLVKAVRDGIGLFVTNIKKHLIGGLISWLTGAMSDVPIQLPEKWDLKGIMHLILQILGLTWDRIRAKLVKRVGERAVAIAEKSVEVVRRLITEGPMALWEMIKAKATEIKQKVMDGIRNWVIVQLVKQAVLKLVSFLNPAGAILQAILAIYNVIMFFVENIQRIIAFVKSVFDSVGDIAMGKLSAAAQAVERAMAMTIPIILGFLGRLIGISGIGKAVSKIITKIRKPIDKVVDKVVDKIAAFAKKLLKKGKAAGKAAKDKIGAFLWPKKTFAVEGESHSLYFSKTGVPMIRSTPTALDSFIKAWERDSGASASPAKKKHLTSAKATLAEIKKVAAEIKKLEKANKKVPKAKHQRMLALQTEISASLKGLLGSKHGLAKAKERYKLEGLTGTFATIPKPTGDHLTGDHQPQAAVIKHLAGRPYFQGGPGTTMRHRAVGHADNAYVINLEGKRHVAGRTFGGKGTATKAAFVDKVKAMEAAEPSAPKRRKEAVKLLKVELREDVKAMRAVYKRAPSAPVWADLDPFVSGDVNAKKKLVGEIRGQVAQGETTLANQPMTELEG